MEFFQLEQIRAIGQHGTISAAAKSMYLTQPTLSHNLKKIEAELGCPLFVRVRNQMLPTPYGEIVLRYAEKIVGLSQNMTDEVAKAKKFEENVLHLGCFSQNATLLVLSCFAALYSDTMFEVANCLPEDLVEGLRSGRFDAIVAEDALRSKEFRWYKLYDEQAYLTIPKEIAEDGARLATAEEMRKYRYIISSEWCGYGNWYRQILAEAGVEDSAISEMPFRDYLRTKDSLPECNLTTSMIMNYVGMNDSRTVKRIDSPTAQRQVGLLYKQDCTEKVLEFVRKVKHDSSYLLSGNAYTSLFLFHEEIDNMVVSNGLWSNENDHNHTFKSAMQRKLETESLT